MATDDSTPELHSNVIPFPAAPEPEAMEDDRPPSDLEIIVICLEEQLGNMEKAALVMAAGIERQREHLAKIKALEGWTWSIPAAPAVFGDAALFELYELRVSERVRKR